MNTDNNTVYNIRLNSVCIAQIFKHMNIGDVSKCAVIPGLRAAALYIIHEHMLNIMNKYLEEIFGSAYEEFKKFMCKNNGIIFGSTLHLLFHEEMNEDPDIDIYFDESKMTNTHTFCSELKKYVESDYYYDWEVVPQDISSKYNNFVVKEITVNNKNIQFVFGNTGPTCDFSIANSQTYFVENNSKYEMRINHFNIGDMLIKKNHLLNLDNTKTAYLRCKKYKRSGFESYTKVDPVFFSLIRNMLLGYHTSFDFDEALYSKLSGMDISSEITLEYITILHEADTFQIKSGYIMWNNFQNENKSYHKIVYRVCKINRYCIGILYIVQYIDTQSTKRNYINIANINDIMEIKQLSNNMYMCECDDKLCKHCKNKICWKKNGFLDQRVKQVHDKQLFDDLYELNVNKLYKMLLCDKTTLCISAKYKSSEYYTIINKKSRICDYVKRIARILNEEFYEENF